MTEATPNFARRTSRKTGRAVAFMSPEQSRYLRAQEQAKAQAAAGVESQKKLAASARGAGIVNDARLSELESKVEALVAMASTQNQGDQISPDLLNAIAVKNDAATSNYVKAVSEGGAGSYNVAKEPSGVFKINNKLVAYYDLP
jgi:hypothetical protein